jgi:hypothetical protein
MSRAQCYLMTPGLLSTKAFLRSSARFLFRGKEEGQPPRGILNHLLYRVATGLIHRLACQMHAYGQNIGVRILGTRAEAWTTFWASAVGVPGDAGAGELCKSVEVHSSDSGDMAQSLTIAKLQHWVQKFSHGCVWTLQADFVLIGQYIIAHAPRNTSVLNPRTPVPSSRTNPPSSTTLLHYKSPTTRKPRRRAERMLPMESGHVRVSSSARLWAADLHRRICEWEVR